MIGLLCLISNAIGSMLSSLKEDAENEVNKKQYIVCDGLCYIDSKARMRLLSNNRIVHRANLGRFGVGGDDVLRDSITMKVYYNFSEMKRKEVEKKYKEAMLRNNNSVYVKEDDPWKYKDVFNSGIRFYDRETDAIYVLRRARGCLYYCDLNKNIIIRPSDSQRYAASKTSCVNPVDPEEYLNESKFISYTNDILDEVGELSFLCREE